LTAVDILSSHCGDIYVKKWFYKMVYTTASIYLDILLYISFLTYLIYLIQLCLTGHHVSSFSMSASPSVGNTNSPLALPGYVRVYMSISTPVLHNTAVPTQLPSQTHWVNETMNLISSYPPHGHTHSTTHNQAISLPLLTSCTEDVFQTFLSSFGGQKRELGPAAIEVGGKEARRGGRLAAVTTRNGILDPDSRRRQEGVLRPDPASHPASSSREAGTPLPRSMQERLP
jgi:hypothetical protein